MPRRCLPSSASASSAASPWARAQTPKARSKASRSRSRKSRNSVATLGVRARLIPSAARTSSEPCSRPHRAMAYRLLAAHHRTHRERQDRRRRVAPPAPPAGIGHSRQGLQQRRDGNRRDSHGHASTPERGSTISGGRPLRYPPGNLPESLSPSQSDYEKTLVGRFDF